MVSKAAFIFHGDHSVKSCTSIFSEILLFPIVSFGPSQLAKKCRKVFSVAFLLSSHPHFPSADFSFWEAAVCSACFRDVPTA